MPGRTDRRETTHCAPCTRWPRWAPPPSTPLRRASSSLRTQEAKERLKPALNPGNVDKTMAAPVTAIIGFDTRFFEHLPRLFPHKDVKGNFDGKPEHAEKTAFRNGTLQGAYFIIAARALGLDVGPLSGFDNAKVDEAFFAGTPVKSNFLCNLGYGDPEGLMVRLPRFDFEEVCEFL